MIKHAALLLLVLGFLFGFGLFGGFVAALLIVLAQNAGAGWRSRHVTAAGRLWRTR